MRTKFKKVLIAVLSLVLILSVGQMIACGDETEEGGNGEPSQITLTLDKTSVSLEIGQSVTLTPTLTGSESAIEWTSSNSAKATVNDGKVTGVDAGSATITAKVGDVQATCEVTVTEVIIPVITLNNSSTQIYKGQPLNLNASVTYEGKEVDAELVYASSNSSVATVDKNGVVTGVSKGSADITVNCTYNGKVATQQTVKITVANLTVVSFTNEDGQTLKTGDTLTLGALVSLNGEEVASPALTYSVSDEDAATISGNVLTALDATEELIITATYMDGEDKVTDSLTVGINYSVAFSGTVELAPENNTGDFLIKTDKTFESATLNGSAITITSATGGYNVDMSSFDVDKTSQDIIFTDADGVKSIANIYNSIKVDSAEVVGTLGSAYTASVQTNVVGYGRTGLTLVTGNSESSWQNCFHIKYNDYLEKGFKYIAFDMLFKQGSNDFVGITSFDPNTFVNLTIGSTVDDDEVALYDLGHNETSFVSGEWVTVIVNLTSYTQALQIYSGGAMSVYIDNVRYMSDGAHKDYVDNYFVYTNPDILEISLDNAIINANPDYKLTRAESAETYQGKTAIKFTGANDSDYKNNLLIGAEYYKTDYKWMLVDFYFNSDTVAFDVKGTINNYAYFTWGSHCTNGSFYVVKEIEGTYYSVPAVKNQWITVAFKLADMREYINGFMSDAVDTYVANIRAVKSSVIDEVKVVSGTIANTAITIGYNGVQMGRTDNVDFYSRAGLVHLVGTPTGTYHNEWHIAGLTELRKAGYSYIAVDIKFQTQGVTGCTPSVWYLADAISIPVGGSPSNAALKIYDVAHAETTLVDDTWTTYIFDLSASTQDFIGFFAAGASEWYIDTITAMTSADLTDFLVKPATVAVDANGFTTKNIAFALTDDIGGRNGVAKCNGTASAEWYDYNIYVYTTQYLAAGYNTFSIDVYLDGESGIFAYYIDSDNASSITFGAASAVEGLRLLDADGENATLGSGAWYTLKFDLTKMTIGAINIFKSGDANIYLDNAYFENVVAE